MYLIQKKVWIVVKYDLLFLKYKSIRIMTIYKSTSKFTMSLVLRNTTTWTYSYALALVPLIRLLGRLCARDLDEERFDAVSGRRLVLVGLLVAI